MGQGGPERARVQPLLFSARCLLAWPDVHRHERSHVGQGHCQHAVLSPAHVLDAVCDRSARAVLLRRDLDDDGGGGVDLSLRAGVLRGDERLLLLRFVYSYCGVPGDAPAVHRSVHLAAHRAGACDLRHPLRAEHRRVVRAARARGPSDVLRQASADSRPEPVDHAARSRGALDSSARIRSRGGRSMAGAAPAQSGVHVTLGDRLRGDERCAGRR